MSSFWGVMRADVQRCVGGKQTSLRRVAIIGVHMGLQAVLVYRFGRLLIASRKRVAAWPLLPVGWLLYGLAAFVVRRAYGIHISLSADIGAGFWVGHFGGVQIMNCRLGQRCSVGQQTHVGEAQQAHGPQVGDGAWIGAHARITGPVRLGNGVTIAPGAHVTRNVPDRALVVGDPGRVVLTGYDNSRILPHP
jgi:serine O-acetyltransferase